MGHKEKKLKTEMESQGSDLRPQGGSQGFPLQELQQGVPRAQRGPSSPSAARPPGLMAQRGAQNCLPSLQAGIPGACPAPPGHLQGLGAHCLSE